MKILDFRKRGGPNVLLVREVMDPRVRDDQVLIQVAATAVNSHDIWRRRGALTSFDAYPYFGFECSGKIVAIGSNVEKFREGDEVCAILGRGGGCAELVAVPVENVLRIPSTVSLVDAAALPQAVCLTIYVFYILKNITSGKTILIHGAAGGFGTIALQYAKSSGFEVFAVAGKQGKLQLCKTLGANYCINYKEENFLKRVKAETGGKGVDIILDVNGRAHFQKNLDCLAVGGSLVILGHKSGDRVDVDLSFLKGKSINILGANLRSLSPMDISSLMSKAEIEFWPLIEDGKIKPVVGKVFSFSEAAHAHRAMEQYSVAGKVLLVPQENQTEYSTGGHRWGFCEFKCFMNVFCFLFFMAAFGWFVSKFKLRDVKPHVKPPS